MHEASDTRKGGPVKTSGRQIRLSIFVGENDIWHHRPVYSEIVHRAHKAGLTGATVLRGVEGYGASSRIHTTHLLRLSQDLPMVIVIADTEDRIRGFLPQLEELELSGLIMLDDVETIQYRTRRR
ncbi:DUF190 domain-containing protein [Nocardia sp. NPDC051570]|uniref:DUF190 domain-containing protein n=1 Tax=Nocardia sp. NPDC051570 TaxID=3364324 RepID=UPI00378A9493